MNEKKKRKLESPGWQTGNVKEFLGLDDQEMLYIELKLALGRYLRRRRLERKMTQAQLAGILNSNQSRVAKMESGDPSVSMDLLVKSLLALGTTKQDLGEIISNDQI